MNIENFKRRLTAILSADVEGYSRLMRDDEDETIRTITAYRTAIAKLVEQYRGRVVDSPGDNILSEFGSSVDAVNCAVEVQRELAERNAELSENRRMQFRIGVNSGDVVEEGERIYGDGVNIAARIEGLAEGGGICISGTVYDSIEGKLGLEFENLGKHEVKNIDKLIRVYRVLSYPGAAAHRVVKAKRAVGRTWRNKMITIAAVLVIIAGAWAVWQFELRPTIPSVEPASVEKMAYPLPDKPSIAVLPFVNIGGDPEQQKIADGITESIITGLSRIPQMFVIAKNSAFTYKGKAIKVKQVSEDLGVQYVLEGSVQKEGDRLRVNAQLIDAIKGQHLWAQKYDRNLKDLFALQDEITMKVITELQVKLTEGEYARALAKGTKNIEAYLKCLNALQFMRRLTKEDNLKAQKMYNEAIALDPNYPRAHLMLGQNYFINAAYLRSKSPKEDLARAENLARKALELDDSLGSTHGLLGEIYLLRKQWDKALSETEIAVSKDPNAFNMRTRAQILHRAGRLKESAALWEEIFRLEPFPPAYFFGESGDAYLLAERLEEAHAQYKLELERAKKGELYLFFPHLRLATSCGLLGMEEEARHHAAEVLRLDPNFSVDRHAKFVRTLYKNPADFEPFINGQLKAGLPEEPPPLPLPEKPSIAVLPFANISGDPKEDYLSDGITEQIITALSRTPKLFVIASNSTFTYKGKPVKIQQVRKDLGVRYVLEGSVQKSGDRVRITAQLIDAITGNHLWADKYDRQLKEIFSLQDDISRNVVMSLQIKLTEGEYARIYGRGTDNLEAFLKAIRGMHHVLRFNKNDNEIARKYYEEAIALDPEYPNAYTLLAWTYRHEAAFGWTKTPEKSRKKAIELAKHAISLDDANAIPHMVFALVYVEMAQFKKALSAGEKGFSLEPNNADVNWLYGYTLRNSGLFQEAVEKIEKAVQLSPINPYFNGGLAIAYFALGEYERAIEAAKKQIKIGRGWKVLAYLRIAASYFLLGNKERAQEAIEQILKINPKFSLEPFAKSWLSIALHPEYRKSEETMFDAVRKAGLK